MRDEVNFGCSEEFAELCALSTSGCLSVGETERLDAHVAVCAQCALLLNQYRTVASVGMAKVAAARANNESSVEKLQNAARLKQRVLSALPPLQARHATGGTYQRRMLALGFVPEFRLAPAAAIAAMLVLAVAGGYLAGVGSRNRRVRSSVAASASDETTLKQQLADDQMQLTNTRRKLGQVLQAANESQAQSEKIGKKLNDLQNEKMALEARIETLTKDGQTRSAAVADLTAQRDTADRELSESQSLLQSVEEKLKAAQDERQQFVLRYASLESQIDQMSAQVQGQEAEAHRSEQYLAADRDVRDLMTARQLYIADVFDVDPRGKTRKPFGRVFYTKGKSLIFYAFDLDQQPGYKEATAFQVWGRQDSGDRKPVSLGIFYLDSEQNRRWALKYNDPKVLDEINALFVTVEPQGGSKRPTNKPFLLAYLHATEPNHP